MFRAVTASAPRRARRWHRRASRASRPASSSLPVDSLAERAGRGLGWLSRGREASDRAERLLFFFTALETLLARKQAEGRVTEMLSRSAAVLWTDDSEKRTSFEKRFKTLYDIRSKLVHRGERGVSDKDANSVQVIAESIFARILTSANLTKPHNAFLGELHRCCDGAPWPQRRQDRLGLFPTEAR